MVSGIPGGWQNSQQGYWESLCSGRRMGQGQTARNATEVPRPWLGVGHRNEAGSRATRRLYSLRRRRDWAKHRGWKYAAHSGIPDLGPDPSWTGGMAGVAALLAVLLSSCVA